MKIQVNLVILSILLLISLSPQMTVVSGISEPEMDLSNDLLESEEFEPYWEKLNLTISPSARRLSPLVYDSENKKTILFGGLSDGGDHNDETWVFDSNTMNWTQMHPNNSPSGRYSHRMVFDPITNKIILFGGYRDAQYLADTWTYDYVTNNWTEVTPTNSPPKRASTSMVYDNTNNIVLMHGGINAGDDTWSYNTTSNKWINMNITGGPGNREGAYYSFDQDNGKFIVYGGWTDPSDTRAYDYKSNTWTNLNSTNEPTKRRSYASNMFYDPIMKRSIFYGGASNVCCYDEIWSFDYDENSWYEINSTNTPGGKWLHGTAYDSYSDFVILFGGKVRDNSMSNETWILHLRLSDIIVNNLPNNIEYNFGSINDIVFNITTENATTYDIFLNDELINSYNYSDNDTISLDLHDIYSQYSYTNFTTIDDTIFQYSNLTLIFRNAQNDTLTKYINVKVIDNIPQIYHDTFDIDHEVGTSQILNFNVSDDNLDSLKVYQNDEQLYSKELNSSSLNLDLNDFMDGSYNLTQYNFTLSFIDTNANNANQTLLVNLLDTNIPVLSLFTVDDYMETETNGLIRFKVTDPTLSSYTLFINNATFASGNISSGELMEISNAGFLEGGYDVTLLIIDRANNSLSLTSSFTVDPYVAPTNTTETTETTETSTETSTEVSTEVSTQTISNTIIPEEPSSDFGSNLLIIIAGIVVGLTGIELFRRQIDKNSK